MTPLNILYIHGFGSRVDVNSDKYAALRTFGQVSAFAPDYTRGYPTVMADVQSYLKGIDLLVGTSMGGFLVSRLSADIGKPYVAINPVMDVAATLNKHLGTHQDHFGRPFTLTDQVVSSYPGFLPSRHGMVLLDMADEVLDSAATYESLHQQMTVHVFEGGNHRFMHMLESLPLIGGFLGGVTAKT